MRFNVPDIVMKLRIFLVVATISLESRQILEFLRVIAAKKLKKCGTRKERLASCPTSHKKRFLLNLFFAFIIL